ncbi:MAG: Lpg1974 family pore-forming outer membrane protein [Rubripirellula sp.]|nr:Lpg1974 family pore-forming outer membrane protein [Rubripirellula sp.]
MNTLLSMGLGVMWITALQAEDALQLGQSLELEQCSWIDFAGYSEVGEQATAAPQLVQVTEEIAQVGFVDLLRNTHTSRDSGCDGCGEAKNYCCCKPWWSHRCGVFAEFLLLRPGSADFIYAVEQNDTTPAAFPTGPVGRVNIDSSAGGRFGFSISASQCSSLEVIYTGWQGDTSDSITANGTNVLNSQVIQPSSLTTGAASSVSSADFDMDFQTVDLAYRRIWRANDNYAINWSGGFRYGNMSQDLTARQNISVASGLVTVDTDVDFEGFGLALGLDAERRSCRTGMMCYSKALSSFLAGDWKGRYRQTEQFSSGVIANDYEDYRVTPVMELELGIGWRSSCGRCRASIGYITTAWYNAVSTREYIDAVRSSHYVNVDETITFSGLTAGLEANF